MPNRRCLVLALALFVMFAGAARAQDDDDTPSLDDTPRITVGGSATSEVTPDLATITLGVSSHAPTAKAAADANATAAQAIVGEARAEGVAPADIATRTLVLSQSFEDRQDANGRFVARKTNGFDASDTVAIRVRDLAKVGALTQALIDKGANSFDGIAFSVEHPQPILDRLAGEAVANARRQADIMARAAGVKLGRMLVIEHAAAEPLRARALAAPMASMARVAAPAMPVEPGSQTLRADVTASFAVEQP